MFWYEQLFIYTTYLVYFLYIITAIGISYGKENIHLYLHYLDFFRQIYIGTTLLLVFNPWSSTKHCTEFHKKIIFSSSLFLLLPAIVSLLNIFLK